MNLKSIAPNQTELNINGYLVFFSYNTPVAYYKDGKYYKTNRFYSMTTSKHISKWIGNNPVELVNQESIDHLVK